MTITLLVRMTYHGELENMDRETDKKMREIRGKIDQIGKSARERGYITDEEQADMDQLEDQFIMLSNKSRRSN